jgi:cell fate (sporulation/competence/biofilm development) regulator YlbF (YheA/YmcA/DUF963 family)
MATVSGSAVILEKTRELCQTIVDQPEFKQIRARIDAFLADAQARLLYETVLERGELLQQKQRAGLPLTQEEIDEFETSRELLLNNPVARAFLEAQRQIQQVQSAVTQWVTKTYEIGRVPTEEDMSDCGSGCSCG